MLQRAELKGFLRGIMEDADPINMSVLGMKIPEIRLRSAAYTNLMDFVTDCPDIVQVERRNGCEYWLWRTIPLTAEVHVGGLCIVKGQVLSFSYT